MTIKPIIIFLLAIPFLYLGFKSIDLSIYKKRRSPRIYEVKEYPVFVLGCAFLTVVGVIIVNFQTLVDFL